MELTSLTVLIFGTSGCAYFTPSMEQMVFDKYAFYEANPSDWHAKVFALNSEHRATIVVCENDHCYFCWAPSPDAAQGIVAYFQNLAQADVGPAQLPPSMLIGNIINYRP